MLYFFEAPVWLSFVIFSNPITPIPNSKQWVFATSLPSSHESFFLEHPVNSLLHLLKFSLKISQSLHSDWSDLIWWSHSYFVLPLYNLSCYLFSNGILTLCLPPLVSTVCAYLWIGNHMSHCSFSFPQYLSIMLRESENLIIMGCTM